MKKKLNNILLIDDSLADNFISKRVIDKTAVAEKVTTTFGGKEALDYLSKAVNGQFPKPEIVFLDINMPGMSGWEFLDEYRLLEETKKAGVIVTMLTTSKAETDKTKANGYGNVSDYSTKPLTKEKLMFLIEKHYPHYL